MCVSVPFHMNMLVPIASVVGSFWYVKLQTMGCCEVHCCTKFHVLIFLLVHVHYINMYLPFFFYVVCTQVDCLPTNYKDNVVKTLSEYCCRCR